MNKLPWDDGCLMEKDETSNPMALKRELPTKGRSYTEVGGPSLLVQDNAWEGKLWETKCGEQECTLKGPSSSPSHVFARFGFEDESFSKRGGCTSMDGVIDTSMDGLDDMYDVRKMEA
ncbi:hypothetical protein FXO38_10533 [Capsicum annuum]|nr:hypothetical protein FXO37_16017 [Capsicum annuum]KAF3663654.1 hypothetical protein FXO38_10533 [Capsicum annuum]